MIDFVDDIPRDLGDLLPLRRGLPALRRMVFALPDVRRHLLEFPLLGRTVIHGDVESVEVQTDGRFIRTVQVIRVRETIAPMVADVLAVR